MKRGLILLKDRPEFLEVDFEKNKNIDFDKLGYRSAIKIWWICTFCKTNYVASPHSKTKSKKCRACYRKSINPQRPKMTKKQWYRRSIAYVLPELAKLWHPTKNGILKPENAYFGKKYWYRCDKGHEFYVAGYAKKRIQTKQMCSKCLGKVVSKEKNFAVEFPEIAKEWDYKKNEKLPSDYTKGSNHKAWWICKKKHSYQCVIGMRTHTKQGCPKCSSNISRPQLRIYAELKLIFPKTQLNKILINRTEIDIFIPEINVGIEYDGTRFHQKQFTIDKDLRKNKIVKKLHIYLIRIREKGLHKLTDNDIFQTNYLLEKKEINQVLIKIKQKIKQPEYIFKIDDYLSKTEFTNNDLFNKLYLDLPLPLFENSIAYTHKHLLKEWDYEKNKNIKPENFSRGNKEKVWWLCEKLKHSTYASIANRAKKNSQCSECSQLKRNLTLRAIASKRKGVKKEFWPDKKPRSRKS